MQNKTSKYHDQRLSEKDVLRLYALGERNFRNALLSGCNFRGADLSEADFSGADIRGTCFVEAILQRANFCHAKAGTRRLWSMVIQAAPYVMGLLSGILQGFFALLIGRFLLYGPLGTSWDDLIIGLPERRMALTAALAIVIPISFAIKYQGFTLKAFKNAAIAVAGVGIVAISLGNITVSGAIAGLLACIVTITVVVAGVITSPDADADAFSATFIFAAFVVASLGVSATRYNASGASIFVSFYFFRVIRNRISQGDLKFENLHTIGLSLRSLGKTSFVGADITNAHFTHDIAKSANFADSRQRSTNLATVFWH